MRGTGLRGALESLRRRGGRLDPDEVRQRLARLEAADMGAYGHLEAHAHAVERLDAADRAAFGHLDAHVATIAELRASVEELRVRSDAHSEQLGILHDLLAATAFVAALPPSDTLVSVVIATRDRPELLREAIASVLGQTHGAFEILVADDGSDPPVETAPDPRIRILRSEASHGASHARNRALDAARGEIVTYLDDDNLVGPHWLRAVVWAFAGDPEAEVAYGALTTDIGERPAHEPWIQLAHWHPHRLGVRNLIDQNALAHRRGLPEARYDEGHAFGSDWDVADRLTRDRPPLRVPVVAATYRSRVHGRLSDRPEARAGWARVQRAMLRRRPLRVLGVGVDPAGLGGVWERCADHELEGAVLAFRPDIAVVAGGEGAERLAARLGRLQLPFAIVADDPGTTRLDPRCVGTWPPHAPPEDEALLAALDDVRARLAGFVPE